MDLSVCSRQACYHSLLEMLPLWKRNAGGIAACSYTMDFYLEAFTCFYVQNKIR